MAALPTPTSPTDTGFFSDSSMNKMFTIYTALLVPIGGVLSLSESMLCHTPEFKVPATGYIGPGWGVNVVNEMKFIINKSTNMLFADPNIGGIPIKASAEDRERTIDVSQSLVIAQTTDSGGKSYVADNAAPRPRTFHVHGHLTSLLAGLDRGLIVKPSLTAQMAMLDFYATSRRPVFFKPYYWHIWYEVLITSIRFNHVPEHMNAVEVDVTMQEWVALKQTTEGINSGRNDDKGTFSMDDYGLEALQRKELIRRIELEEESEWYSATNEKARADAALASLAAKEAEAKAMSARYEQQIVDVMKAIEYTQGSTYQLTPESERYGPGWTGGD